jgi:2-polyprenyl-3-methyl-5-hydroxy-6-metoxy-1,4-benzoquinol methylase
MDHLDKVRSSFTEQAGHFSEPGLTLSDPVYLEWMTASLPLSATFRVLDIAAGTGHLSRALALHVAQVIALDATPAMLAEGEKAAQRAGLTNITFQCGLAERLPFGVDHFDLVTCRFAIHHFAEPEHPIDEMIRVCRPGGHVALIDLISPDDPELAASHNRLEALRDPAHTRALARYELEGLLKQRGLTMETVKVRTVPVVVDRWLALTKTDEQASALIRQELTAELNGGPATGMQPFIQDEALCFKHTWAIVVGRKLKGY